MVRKVVAVRNRGAARSVAYMVDFLGTWDTVGVGSLDWDLRGAPRAMTSRSIWCGSGIRLVRAQSG